MYNEKLEGKLVLTSEGYLSFESKSLSNYREIPDYFPLELFENNKWVEYNLIFDKEDNIYYVIPKENNKKYKLKKDNICRVDFILLLMLERHREDCRLRDKIAYEYVTPETHESYIIDYCRQTQLA